MYKIEDKSWKVSLYITHHNIVIINVTYVRRYDGEGGGSVGGLASVPLHLHQHALAQVRHVRIVRRAPWWRGNLEYIREAAKKLFISGWTTMRG